ncbi:MAG: hypothetical protein AAGM67_08770, partial [Bacteroidota bacterium]
QILTSSFPAYQRFCKAFMQYAKGDYSKMGRYEQEAIGMDSSFAWAAFTVANKAFQSLRNDDLAQQYIQIAMEHRKRLPDIFEARVRQLGFRIADEPQKALELSKLLVELNPGNFSYRSVLINDYMSQDQYEAALEQVKFIQQHNDNRCTEFYLEGTILLRLGRIEEGIERGLSCQEAEPDNAFLVQTLGELYLADEKYELATQMFQRADLLESKNLNWDKFSAHLSYLQDSMPEDIPALQKTLSGSYYRPSSTISYYEVSTYGQLLFIVGERQIKYFSYYPVGGNRFVSVAGHQASVSFDEDGKPTSIFLQEPNGRKYTIKFIPPPVEDVRLKTIEGDFAAAAEALDAIPAENQNGWMYESLAAIQAFRKAGTTFNPDGISGEYMDEEGFGIRISLSDAGEIEVGLTRNPNIGNFVFVPVGKNELLSLELLERNYHLVRENGIVSKLEIHYPDKEPLVLNRASD